MNHNIRHLYKSHISQKIHTRIDVLSNQFCECVNGNDDNLLLFKGSSSKKQTKKNNRTRLQTDLQNKRNCRV